MYVSGNLYDGLCGLSVILLGHIGASLNFDKAVSANGDYMYCGGIMYRTVQSLCYIPEINITLCIHYASIRKDCIGAPGWLSG